jgi:phage shock protein A
MEEDSGGGTHGPVGPDVPTPPTTPPTELRRVTRSLTGSRKRRRAVVDNAFTGRDELTGRDFFGSNTHPIAFIEELLTVVISLQNTIKEQNKVIEKLRDDVKAIKGQNASLGEDIKVL